MPSNIFNSIGQTDVVRLRSSGTARGVRRPYVEKNRFYTDHQIFDRYQRYRIRGELDRSESLTIQELNSLKVGDYVVHIDHGVGRFGGLYADDRERQGARGDQAPSTANNHVLLVNVHALHRISKYKDKDSEPPDSIQARLGGMAAHEAQHEKGCQGHRPRADRAVREASGQPGLRLFARQLHAARAGSLVHLRGHARPANGHAARQAGHGKSRADGPVVCGDVGFGKTEIAIRAAFKAVTDSKQVAVLVPTTILALQHYRTFNERLEGVPRPHRAPEPPQKREGDAPDSRRGQKRQDRHPDRHAQDTWARASSSRTSVCS